jgi:hypothetical protein
MSRRRRPFCPGRTFQDRLARSCFAAGELDEIRRAILGIEAATFHEPEPERPDLSDYGQYVNALTIQQMEREREERRRSWLKVIHRG